MTRGVGCSSRRSSSRAVARRSAHSRPLLLVEGVHPRVVMKLLGYRHDRAIQIAHSLRLAHTVGVNGFFADLVAIARHSPTARPGDGIADASRAVTAWWSEARCARLFGEHVRPDAYGRRGTHQGAMSASTPADCRLD